MRAIFGELAEKYDVGDKVSLEIYRARARKQLTIQLPLSSAFD